MGKLALWIGVAILIMLLLRLFGPGRSGAADKTSGGEGRGDRSGGRSKQSDRADPHGRDGADELMMGCAMCGVYLPASDAVFAHGKVYCCAEHRDQDEARGQKGPT